MFAVMNTAITGVIVLHNIQNIDTVTYCTMLSAEVYWNETKNRIRLVVCSICSSPAKIENFQSLKTAFPLIVKKAYDKKNIFYAGSSEKCIPLLTVFLKN